MTRTCRYAMCSMAVALAVVAPSIAFAGTAPSARQASYFPPGSPTYARFTVSASGYQLTTWKQPTFTRGDCYSRYTWTAKGRELVKFKSVTRKMLAVDEGLSLLFHYGSWNPLDFRMSLWPANGTTKRQDLTTSTYKGGPCGIKPRGKRAPEDCNPTRIRHWDLFLEYDATDRTLRVEFNSLHPVRDGRRGARFETCPLETPPGAEPDTISMVRKVFTSGQLMRIHGTRVLVFQQTWPLETSAANATTTVRFRVTLVRH